MVTVITPTLGHCEATPASGITLIKRQHHQKPSLGHIVRAAPNLIQGGVYKFLGSPVLSKLPTQSRHGNKTCANTQSFRDIGRVFLSVFLTLLSIQERYHWYALCSCTHLMPCLSLQSKQSSACQTQNNSRLSGNVRTRVTVCQAASGWKL